MASVNREKLLQRLQNAIVGAEKGEFLTNAFSFRDGYVHTFKDFIALSIYLGDEFKFLTGSIRATEFFALLSKYTSDTIDITTSESGLEISSGRSHAVFTFLEDSVLKQVDNMALSTLVWNPIPVEFREALSYCLLGAREYNLEGVRVRGDVVLSVDSKRANRFVMSSNGGDFLLEERVLSELLKFQDFVEYSVSPQRVFIRLNGGTIVSGRRKVDSEYPTDKILRMIETLAPDKADPHGVLPEGFRAMMSRASILSGDLSGLSVVKLTFTKECIQASSQRSTGKYDEKLGWEKEPEGLEEPITVCLESSSAFYALEKSSTFAIKSVNGLKRFVFIGENCSCYLAAYMERTGE